MKKNLVILLAIALSLSIFAKTSIEGNNIVIDKGIYKLSIMGTENSMLKVDFIKKNSKKAESEFFIEKKSSGEAPVAGKDFMTLAGYKIAEEENGFVVYMNDKKLFRSSFEITDAGIQETKECLDKELFYGLGEANDKLAIISKNFKIRNAAEYGNQARLYVPFVFSSGGDSFYYNAYTNDGMKFGRKDESKLIYTTEKESYNYYFWNEKNPKENVKKFYEFSKSKSMIPKWTFGYIQSKYGYETQQELMDIVNKFKEKDIPLSAVVLDLQWFKKMGDLDWNREKWPNPEEMDKFLEKNGVKLITISEPYFTVDSKNYKEYEDNGLFGKYADGKTINWGDWWCFGADYGAIMNPIAPKANEIIGKKYTNMVKTGIDGFWTDLGEPENADQRTMFNQYSEVDFHNYYNREWSRLVYDSLRKEYPDKRVLILSRSGFTGSAKYGVSIWSGDVSASFIGLRKQAVLGINSGMTGFSYWGSDVGGFVSGEKIPTEELFVRWMQFGTFTPVFRAHGAMSSREPWIYPGKSEDIITKYIKLRYEMMPYIYSSAYETYKNGIPIMRAFMMEYPEDKENENIGDQYFFGEYLMVAPVLLSKESEEEKEIYIPDDCFDFYTFDAVKKGKLKFKPEIDKIPVFVKKGAILPFEKNGNLVITLVPDKKTSKFTLYNDDGITNEYEKGKYEAIEIALDKKGVIFNNVANEKEVELRILKSEADISEKGTEDGKFVVKTVKLLKGENIIKF